MTFVNVQIVSNKGPVVLLDDCFDITIQNASRPKVADTFIQLTGEKTKGIKVDGVEVRTLHANQ